MCLSFIYFLVCFRLITQTHLFLIKKKEKEERSILDVAMETEKVVRILELKPDV